MTGVVTFDLTELEQLRQLVAEQADEIARLRVQAGLDRAEPAFTTLETGLWLSAQAAGIGVFDHDMITGARRWDARTRAIFCLPDLGDDATGVAVPDDESFLRLVYPDDRDRFSALRKIVSEDPDYGPFVQAYRIALPQTGEVRWLESFGQAIYAGGRCVRMVGVTKDVTDRHHLLDALARMQQTLDAQVAARTEERDGVWLTSQELMLVMDSRAGVLAANPAWLELLGHAPGEILGNHGRALLHSQDRPAAVAALRKLIDGERLPLTELRLRHASGGYRVIAWTAVPAGERIYVIGRDITARREAAAPPVRSADDLRQSQKMEAVGQLTGGLAHDFNNLLTGIMGGLDLLKRRLSAQRRTEEIDRFIDTASSSASRAAAISHRLLAFSRQQTLEPRPTDAGELVGSLIELIRRTVGPEITVFWQTQTGLWPVLCDPNQLENALLNLAINARDAMPGGGQLSISCKNVALASGLHGADGVILEVTDTGTGMSAAVQSRVFEPFFTTKPTGRGTGLGLSMVYSFVRQSGGQISIASSPGNGAIIGILLPRTSPPPLASGANFAEPRAAKPVPSVPGEISILVVDDEPGVRMVVVEALQGLGYGVQQAASGPEVMRMVDNGQPFDILISDVGLPGGMNGRELAEAVRSVRPAVQVLLITGYAEHPGAELQRSGMQVLTKPFGLDLLGERVAQLATRLVSRPAH